MTAQSPTAFLTAPFTSETERLAFQARARVTQLSRVLAEDYAARERITRMSWPVVAPAEKKRRRHCPTVQARLIRWLFHHGEFRRVGR